MDCSLIWTKHCFSQGLWLWPPAWCQMLHKQLLSTTKRRGLCNASVQLGELMLSFDGFLFFYFFFQKHEHEVKSISISNNKRFISIRWRSLSLTPNPVWSFLCCNLTFFANMRHCSSIKNELVISLGWLLLFYLMFWPCLEEACAKCWFQYLSLYYVYMVHIL